MEHVKGGFHVGEVQKVQSPGMPSLFASQAGKTILSFQVSIFSRGVSSIKPACRRRSGFYPTLTIDVPKPWNGSCSDTVTKARSLTHTPTLLNIFLSKSTGTKMRPSINVTSPRVLDFTISFRICRHQTEYPSSSFPWPCKSGPSRKERSV
jgi:hypothetical protein